MPLNNGLRKKTQNRFNEIYFFTHYTIKIKGWFTLDKIKLELLALARLVSPHGVGLPGNAIYG